MSSAFSSDDATWFPEEEENQLRAASFPHDCIDRFAHPDNESTHRAVALMILMLCCSCGTPVTLLCTLTGYVLVDQVLQEHGDIYHLSLSLSRVLNTTGRTRGSQHDYTYVPATY